MFRTNSTVAASAFGVSILGIIADETAEGPFSASALPHLGAPLAALRCVRLGTRVGEDQALETLRRQAVHRERHVAAHGKPGDRRTIDLEAVHQREDVTRVGVHRRRLVPERRVAESAQIRRDEPDAGRHAVQLRPPHLGPQRKPVHEDDRPPGPGFKDRHPSAGSFDRLAAHPPITRLPDFQISRFPNYFLITLISNTLGHHFPVTKIRSVAAS